MLKNHPKGLITLFFTEMWERFGFYTMLAVFTLYMDETLGWSDAHKGQIYGLFLGFVYFTPIAGGWIADRFLGYRKTIIWGAIILGFGYALLAISGPERIWLFYVALIVMVSGNGLFKANISVLVGNLYEPGSPYKDVGYNIFYMGINLGAFIAPLAATFLHDVFGTYNAAFGAAAVGMALSLVVFEIWKRNYIHADNKHKAGRENQKVRKAEKLTKTQEKERINALGIIFLIVIFFWMSFHQNGFALTLFAKRSTIDKYKITETDFNDWESFKKAALADSIPFSSKLADLNLNNELSGNDLEKINKLLLDPDLFYKDGKRLEHLAFEQTPKSELVKDLSIFGLYTVKIPYVDRINLQKLGRKLDALHGLNNADTLRTAAVDFRVLNRELLSARYSQIKPGYFLLKPETYATFNPLFILLLTPLVVSLFNWLRKYGKEPSSPGKIGIGMFISGLSMIIMVVASLMGGNADANNLSPNWLISSYFVVTIGELFLSPMGLSFVSKVAPARMRGLMMGGWFGATAIGNYMSGLLGGFYNTLTHDQFFTILVVLLFLSALAVRLFLKKLKHATDGA